MVALIAIQVHGALNPHVELCLQEDDQSFLGTGMSDIPRLFSPAGVPFAFDPFIPRGCLQ